MEGSPPRYSLHQMYQIYQADQKLVASIWKGHESGVNGNGKNSFILEYDPNSVNFQTRKSTQSPDCLLCICYATMWKKNPTDCVATRKSLHFYFKLATFLLSQKYFSGKK